MEKKFKLLPPLMPNFITYETPRQSKGGGVKLDGNKISIADLDKEEAIEYGELMKQEFIRHWQARTSAKTNSSVFGALLKSR